MKDDIKKVYEYIVQNELPKIVLIVEEHMNFERWGFKQTFYGIAAEFPPSVIYDSERCRVRFFWQQGEPRDGYDILRVRYGRLHASNNKQFITWNGQLCHCWHDIRLALHFLDGLSIQQTVERRYKWTGVIEQFRQSHRDSGWSEFEWTARIHAFVWDYYGNRLFDLFDLRQSTLWERYEQYMKEFHRFAPRIPNYDSPPPENIC